jgi:hypothetical protein
MCVTTDNFDLFCDGLFLGGADPLIYVANRSQIDTFTSTLGDKTINSITMKTDPLTTDPYFWYSFACVEGTVGYTENKAGDLNIYAVQSVNFSIQGLTAANKAKLEALCTSVLAFIIKDNKGEYHLLGKPAGLKCEVLDSGSGVAEDDLYGATITFSKAVGEWSSNMAIGSTIEVYDGVSAAVTVTLD